MLFFLELASFSLYVLLRPRLFLLSPAGCDGVCVRQTAKYVRESYDALVDIFECIETFLSRLKIYAGIQPTPALTQMVIKILVELLGVLALATKQINQGRLSTSGSIFLGSDVNRWVDPLQRNLQGNYWERKTSNWFFSASIDSPSRSPG